MASFRYIAFQCGIDKERPARRRLCAIVQRSPPSAGLLALQESPRGLGEDADIVERGRTIYDDQSQHVLSCTLGQESGTDGMLALAVLLARRLGCKVTSLSFDRGVAKADACTENVDGPSCDLAMPTVQSRPDGLEDEGVPLYMAPAQLYWRCMPVIDRRSLKRKRP